MQLSFGAAWSGEWAFVVALGVVAFRDGGPAAVGLVAFLRMAPPALIAPFSSVLADRFRRDHVLIVSGAIRAGALAAGAGLLAAGVTTVAVYALAVLASGAFVAYRPAHSALLPALCRTPLEFTSATVVRGLIGAVSTVLGPAASALILGISSPAAAFGFVAGLSALSALLVVRLSYEAPAGVAYPGVQGILSQVGEGFRALAGQREASLLVRLALAQTFTRGCLTVLLVVVAFDLLGTGAAGAGVLTAALGVGAVAGSIGALASVTGRRLATIQAVGVALWGVPLVLSGAFPNGVAILGFMCAIGVGNALVDIGLFTLLARLAPQHLMGRIFGALEGLIALMVALGALVTPLLIHVLGVRGALIAVGVVAPTLVAFVWPHLRHIDAFIVRRDDEIAMLKRVGMLQPLPLLAIENLALRTERSHVAAGADVFQQGDSGDRFYIIHHGEADVIGDGRLIRVLGPGDCFGEVALLHDVRRTATVRARTDLDLCTLERDVFLGAVGDYSVSAREADGLARDRLDAFTPSTFPPA